MNAQTLAAMLHSNAVRQRLEPEIEQRLGRKEAQAERTLRQHRARDPTGFNDPRQQQGVGPHRKADHDAGDGAPGGGLAPDQATEEGRRELGNGGKRHEADRCQPVRLSQQPVEEVSEEHDAEDRHPTYGQQQPRHILLVAAGFVAAVTQQQRQDQTIADHDRQRDRVDDHHGGGRRQASDERQQRDGLRAFGQGQGQHEGVGIERPLRQPHQPGRSDRHHEQVDQHEIDREQPGCALQLPLGVVLHHGDMELARQQHDADHAQERHGHPRAAVQALREDFAELGPGADCVEEVADAAEHGEHHEEADRQERRQLDQRLGGDRDDQAFLVLGGIDVAGAEQDGEDGHRYRDDECRVGRKMQMAERARPQQGIDRKRHRLQLQGDVRQRAGHRDDRDDGRHGLALAVARGQEVGHRGDVLALGQPHDAQQDAPAEHEQQDRPEIDGEEIIAGRCGQTHAAEEGPGRAVDRQRQSIGQRTAAGSARARGAVGIPRHREKDAHVSERERNDAPAFDHACCFSARDRAQGTAPTLCFLRNMSIVRKALAAVQRTRVSTLNKRDFPPSRYDLGLPAWGASHRFAMHF